MRPIVFEVCAERLEDCLAAQSGGAHRIELCSALEVGGLTPAHGLVRNAVQQVGLPIHVMLRPRAGNSIYTDEEFAAIEHSLAQTRQLGISGVVVGLLRPDGKVDAERTARIVDAAAPLEVTFHRAFDELADLAEGLEEVIATGCRRVLTSGGAEDVAAGAETLQKLVDQAAGRIHIALGGGLRLHNAAALARSTGATHFHGSMRRFPGTPESHVDPDDIRAILRELREG